MHKALVMLCLFGLGQGAIRAQSRDQT